MDSLDDPSDAGPTGSAAVDIGDFVVGLLAQNPLVRSLDF
jgi:hypothetical protein